MHLFLGSWLWHLVPPHGEDEEAFGFILDVLKVHLSIDEHGSKHQESV